MAKIYYNRILNASVAISSAVLPNYTAAHATHESREVRLFLDGAAMIFDLSSNRFVAGVFLRCNADTVLDGRRVLLGSDITSQRTQTHGGRALSPLAHTNRYVAITPGDTKYLQQSAIKAEYVVTGALNNYSYFPVWGGSYVVGAGDHLEYTATVISAPVNTLSGAGGLEIVFSGSPTYGRNVPLVDAIGQPLNNPSSSVGVAHTRLINLSAIVGKSIQLIQLANESDAVGKYVVEYKNIRVVNASVTEQRFLFWAGGPPLSAAAPDEYGMSMTKISFGGAPTNGEDYFSFSQACFFAASAKIICPNIGLSIERVFPRAEERMSGGRLVAAATGEPKTRVRGQLIVDCATALEREAVDQLINSLRSDVVCLDLEHDDNKNWFWLLRASSAVDKMTASSARTVTIDIDAEEV